MPLLVCPWVVEDGVTEEPEIAGAVRGLEVGRARGPSGMQAVDIKGWLQ